MSRTPSLTAAITLMALLAGCAPGLIGGDKQSDPNLDRILFSDSDVPAKQGLLFIAMQDAEIALQSAGYAMAADQPSEAKGQISNLLYAIDPEFPPTSTITSSGVALFWPGTGYGLRHAVQGIADQMRSVSSRHGARAPVVDQAGQVAACTEEMLSRTNRVVSLGQQVLAAGTLEEMAPMLAEIDRLTHIMLEAPAAQAVDACSLEDAKVHLDGLALQLA
jgi:hypothetical protein